MKKVITRPFQISCQLFYEILFVNILLVDQGGAEMMVNGKIKPHGMESHLSNPRNSGKSGQ